jgi:hypothetical protein
VHVFRNYFLTVYIHTMGRVVHGTNCPWGEISVGQNVRGAKCPWSEMSMGRDVRGAKCLWGEMSWSKLSWGELSWASCPGASCPGASCLGASGPGTPLKHYFLVIKCMTLLVCDIAGFIPHTLFWVKD